MGIYIQGTGNTNIAGAIIANITNFEVDDAESACLRESGGCFSNPIMFNRAIDGGNLNLNTASLNYSDLNNHNNSESSQFSTNLQS